MARRRKQKKKEAAATAATAAAVASTVNSFSSSSPLTNAEDNNNDDDSSPPSYNSTVYGTGESSATPSSSKGDMQGAVFGSPLYKPTAEKENPLYKDRI